MRLIKILENHRDNIIFGGESSKEKLKIAPTIIDKNEKLCEITGKVKDRPDLVDAIIVTPFLEFEEIEKFLHKQWRCRVISIEELIMESL